MSADQGKEGLSTGKKMVAGAAIGVVVPAAVGVAKKLLSNTGDDDGEAKEGGDQGSPSRSSSASTGSRQSQGTSSRQSQGKASSKSTTKSSARTSGSRRTGGSSRSSASSSKSRSAGGRASGRTKEQLYNQAKRLNIEGRSKMTKDQLERAIARKRS